MNIGCCPKCGNPMERKLFKGGSLRALFSTTLANSFAWICVYCNNEVDRVFADINGHVAASDEPSEPQPRIVTLPYECELYKYVGLFKQRQINIGSLLVTTDALFYTDKEHNGYRISIPLQVLRNAEFGGHDYNVSIKVAGQPQLHIIPEIDNHCAKAAICRLLETQSLITVEKDPKKEDYKPIKLPYEYKAHFRDPKYDIFYYGSSGISVGFFIG